MTSVPPLRFGVLGTGWMLAKYAEAFRLLEGVALVAVASRDSERARAAAAQYGISRAHPNYESLLADPEIDIVINALHNGLHCEWTVRALGAGKHVLCEKPLACSSAEVERMFAAAHAHKRHLMEGFMYRFHPQLAEAKRRVAAGEIGRVVHIRSTRTAYGRPHDNPRYWRDAGGGALMDIGCYCLNFMRFFADAEPKSVEAQARFDPAPSGTGAQTRVDFTLSGSLHFDAGLTAQFVCSMEAEPTYASEILGTEGKLLIPHPWMPPTWPTEFCITRHGKTETIRVEAPEVIVGAASPPRPGGEESQPPNLTLMPFALELQHFARFVRENRAPQYPPDVDAERDSRGNMRVIEALLTSAREGHVVGLPVIPTS
jgi:predicted dehydrogenase